MDKKNITSKGKTAKGKAISSKNALKHGLTATKHFITKYENEKDYESLLECFINDFSPTTQTEYSLIETMAQSRWKLNRLSKMEKTLIEIETEKYNEKKLIEETVFGGLDKKEKLACSFDKGLEKIWAPYRSYPNNFLLMRYETHFQNQFYKALKTLLEFRKECQ